MKQKHTHKCNKSMHSEMGQWQNKSDLTIGWRSCYVLPYHSAVQILIVKAKQLLLSQRFCFRETISLFIGLSWYGNNLLILVMNDPDLSDASQW